MDYKEALSEEELQALLGEEKKNVQESYAFTELSAEEISRKNIEEINLQLLLNIPLEIVVELGRTKKKISEVLELTNGSIIELEKIAGEPLDVYVNNKLIAKGEVVVIEEHFGVRITEICQSAL
jgi:flagellar motor switch protein FliN/FliY